MQSADKMRRLHDASSSGGPVEGDVSGFFHIDRHFISANCLGNYLLACCGGSVDLKERRVEEKETATKKWSIHFESHSVCFGLEASKWCTFSDRGTDLRGRSKRIQPCA